MAHFEVGGDFRLFDPLLKSQEKSPEKSMYPEVRRLDPASSVKS